MRFIIVLLCISGLHFTASFGQYFPYNADQKYSKVQLRADFRFLRNALEEAHPSLYWYTPKESMDAYFEEVYAQITHEMTEQEFLQLLKPLISKIKCGHTDLRPSVDLQKFLRQKRRTFLPFAFDIQGDRLFIVRNNSTDSSLTAGTEILAIDGHSAGKILRTLRKYLPADGYTDNFKNATLEAGFFDEYYWDVFGDKECYEFTIKDTLENVRMVSPRLRPRTRRYQPYLSKEQETEQRLNRLRNVTYPEAVASTAMLQINSFSYDEYESFQMYHDKVFKELEQKGILNLVLDLRQNSGGNHEIALDLMRFLADTTFVLTAKGYSPVWKPSFIESFEEQPENQSFTTRLVKKNAEGEYLFNAPSVGPNKPYEQYRFKGNLFVLTAGQTFSAASNFVASLKAQRKITVIGRETGGGEAGCNGGIISKILLPETSIRLQFPHFRILTAMKTPNIGRGVIPDYEIHYTTSQKAQKQDLDLEKALDLIRKMELSDKR